MLAFITKLEEANIKTKPRVAHKGGKWKQGSCRVYDSEKLYLGENVSKA